MFKEVVHFIVDCIFPVFCLGCKKEGTMFCEGCVDSVNIQAVFACPCCHIETKGGRYCDACLSKEGLYLDAHVAMGRYGKGEALSKIIHALKYQYIEDMQKILIIFVTGFLKEYPDVFEDIDLVCIIPLHKKRFAERGFNQCDAVGKAMAEYLEIPYVSLLKRVRATKRQATLQRVERLKNLTGAFVINDKVTIDLNGKRVLLIDDVFTTGSTLQAGARVLKDAGVREVIGFSLARG